MITADDRGTIKDLIRADDREAIKELVVPLIRERTIDRIVNDESFMPFIKFKEDIREALDSLLIALTQEEFASRGYLLHREYKIIAKPVVGEKSKRYNINIHKKPSYLGNLPIDSPVEDLR